MPSPALLQVALQKRVGEGPHRELRARHVAPDLGAVAGHADGGDQRVAAAPQPPQLPARVVQVHRLVEPLLAADKQLVGADDEGAGRAGADPAGLERCKRPRGLPAIRVLGPHGVLDRALVHPSRLHGEREPRRPQHRRAHGRLGGEHETPVADLSMSLRARRNAGHRSAFFRVFDLGRCAEYTLPAPRQPLSRLGRAGCATAGSRRRSPRSSGGSRRSPATRTRRRGGAPASPPPRPAEGRRSRSC